MFLIAFILQSFLRAQLTPPQSERLSIRPIILNDSYASPESTAQLDQSSSGQRNLSEGSESESESGYESDSDAYHEDEMGHSSLSRNGLSFGQELQLGMERVRLGGGGAASGLASIIPLSAPEEDGQEDVFITHDGRVLDHNDFFPDTVHPSFNRQARRKLQYHQA